MGGDPVFRDTSPVVRNTRLWAMWWWGPLVAAQLARPARQRHNSQSVPAFTDFRSELGCVLWEMHVCV